MKKDLRQKVLAQMRQLPAATKSAADTWLTQQLLSSRAYQESEVLATYLPLPHEVATSALISQALSEGKRVLVPKTYGQGRMIFVGYNADQLQRTSFGLLEPISEDAVPSSEIDLIHVPGLVFNQDHYRIGYGGGYYDRYLADFSGAAVSTIYDFQLAAFVPSSHDIPVKELLIYEFS